MCSCTIHNIKNRGVRVPESKFRPSTGQINSYGIGVFGAYNVYILGHTYVVTNFRNSNPTSRIQSKCTFEYLNTPNYEYHTQQLLTFLLPAGRYVAPWCLCENRHWPICRPCLFTFRLSLLRVQYFSHISRISSWQYEG